LKRLIVFLCFSLICLNLYAIDLDPDKFMTVDKIKPGMKGIGKTVFSGTKIEEFQIEVLEVAKNVMRPKSDVIWVLCSGGPLAETGVISGMSGSPVYIDGKLIGAIAYRMGSFAKRPIAGVTPIADMLRIIDNADKYESVDEDRLNQGSFPFSLQKSEYAKGEPLNDGLASIVPIQMPIAVSGFSHKTIEYISPMLKDLGMVPVQGGGVSAATDTEEPKVEPGAVMVVEFVKGDASASGSGTITYVDGNKVLAFGHSIYEIGKTEFPASIGKISLLVPSMLSSSKIGSPVRTIGTLTQDNAFGVMSIMGKQPDFIPMKVRFKSAATGVTEEYNFEIAKHRLFAPTYIFSVAFDVIATAGKSVGDYTIKTHSEIIMKNYPKIVKDNVYSGLSPDIAAEDFASPISMLMANKFEEVDIQSVLFEAELDDSRTNASIDDAQISKSKVKPGDSLNVRVSITPYMQDTIVKQLEVVIPTDAPEGRSLLRISDATASQSWEAARAPMKSRIANIPQLIQRIQDEESNNDIIIELFSPKAGVTIRGDELPALPLTAFSVINSSKYAGVNTPTLGTTFLKQKIHTDYVISGSLTLPLLIDRDAQ